MVAEHLTFCRICESACGLIATVEGGRVERLRPDPEHPRSEGYACVKGTRFAAVQHHPERLLRPRLRRTRGAPLEEVSWDEALAFVGQRIAALRGEHGPQSVGLFLGNSTAHSLGAILGATALQQGLRTTKAYSVLTLDNAPMFVVTEQCLGHPLRTLVADYGGSDCVVLVGTDPLSSQPSQAQSHPRGVPELAARARAGQLWVVDPRASLTAGAATHHLRPRPGSDAALLACLVRGAAAAWRDDGEEPLLEASDVAALADAVAAWTPTAAAAATGLEEAEILALGEALATAHRPLVWSGLGVLLGPEGTVGYWLTLALQALLGGLDRPGGWLFHGGAVDLAPLLTKLGIRGRDEAIRSRVRGLPAILGTLASADLASDVLEPGPDRLRGLIVVGGSPRISLPDSPRAAAALDALELLVSIDLFVNDTGAGADVVLPAATWLERDDVGLHMAAQRRIPHLQHARAVVPAPGEAREDWQVLCDLAAAAGVPLFGSVAADKAVRWLGLTPTKLAAWVIRFRAPFTWKRLTSAPRGVVAFGGLPGRLAEALGGTPIRLAVPEFVAALATGVGVPPGPFAGGAGHPLQLITSVRPLRSMNTWIQPGGAPTATLHPADLEALGLGSGARLALRRPDGPGIELEVAAEPRQRPGTVVVPYGWGHREGSVHGARGVNANVLVGTDRLEAFTGQPMSNGGWVLASAATTD